MTESVVSTDFSRAFVAGLTREYSDQLDDEVYFSRLRRFFESRLQVLGVRFERWYLPMFAEWDGAVCVLDVQRGRVEDINLVLLRRLRSRLRRLHSEVKIVVSVAPGQVVDNEPAIWAVFDGGDESGRREVNLY